METKIIPIGNSRGIRIPKAMLAQCGLEGNATLEPKEGKLIIRPVPPRSRQGWADDAKRCAAGNEDKILWPEDMQDSFDDEWEW